MKQIIVLNVLLSLFIDKINKSHKHNFNSRFCCHKFWWLQNEISQITDMLCFNRVKIDK